MNSRTCKYGSTSKKKTEKVQAFTHNYANLYIIMYLTDTILFSSHVKDPSKIPAQSDQQFSRKIGTDRQT